MEEEMQELVRPARRRSPSPSALWIFGYGSLCWHPGFEYKNSVVGYVRGYSRKFWQGNTTHRGTCSKPGRVATLIEDKQGIVWGRAFEIQGEAAMPYLDDRECKLGGYMVQFTTFYPRHKDNSPLPRQIPTVLYVATPSNCHWLGDAPLCDIATQIVECCGPSGYNAEYLLRLAEFMHEHVPEAQDEHLFSLETLVRKEICRKNLCIKTLMGETGVQAVAEQEQEEDDGEAEGAAGPIRVDSFQFTSRVPEKKLRCLKI